MKTSIIIATRDRHEELNRCLRSLVCQEHRPDEVVIVDASLCPWESQEEFPFPVHVIKTEPRLTRQRNQGFQASRGDLIIYLDDDVELEPGYLAAMIAAFEADTRGEIGAATGCITNVSRPGWRHPLRSLLWLFNLVFQLPDLGSGRFRLSGFPTFPYHREEACDIEVLSGCNMAFRRQVLQQFQFDERLTGYAYIDDDDMAYRVSRHYRCLYVPRARLAHLSAPKPRAGLRAHKQMLAWNHAYIFRKNLPRSFRRWLAFALSIAGLIIAALVVEHSPAGAWGILEGLAGAWRVRFLSPIAGEVLPAQD
ncbi:MAG: glycosyltransferase family 2 protein [Anaerolineae bacterium]